MITRSRGRSRRIIDNCTEMPSCARAAGQTSGLLLRAAGMVLQPNIGGGFWKIPSADCYAGGIAPRWYVEVWGDHNRPGAVFSSAH